jgi:hypothetical protein
MVEEGRSNGRNGCLGDQPLAGRSITRVWDRMAGPASAFDGGCQIELTAR